MSVRGVEPFAEPARQERPAESRILLRGVSWEFYERFLKELGEQRISVAYDRGDLELMAPSYYHDISKTFIARLLETMTFELGIEMVSAGSTTCKRKDLAKGLEPDECYYIQHEALMRKKKNLDLRRDPPPDLALEVDITNSSVNREGIYASLGVPELWRYEGGRLRFFVLGPDRAYHPVETSAAIAGLKSADLERFVRMRGKMSENQVLHAFLKWLRKEFKKN